MRPLFLEYHQDPKTYKMEDQYLVGSDLLVKPVTEEKCKSISVYLPGGSETLWYQLENLETHHGGGDVTLKTELSTIPVFIKGGAIISRADENQGRSWGEKAELPMTLWIWLDAYGKAKGSLYADDGITNNFKNGQYNLRNFEFDGQVLKNSDGSSGQGKFEGNRTIGGLTFVGLKGKRPSKISLSQEPEQEGKILKCSIKTHVQPGCVNVQFPEPLKVASDWRLTFFF